MYDARIGFDPFVPQVMARRCRQTGCTGRLHVERLFAEKVKVYCDDCTFSIIAEQATPRPARQPQETQIMARSPKSKPDCLCGCGKKSLARGLCGRAYDYWHRHGKPDVAGYVAGKTSPCVSGAVGRQPRKAAQPSAPVREAAPPPKTSTALAPASASGLGFIEISLSRPMDKLRIGRLGSFLTITDEDGEVLHQVRATEA